MVTIEQKVLLFSKLINQLMSNEFKESLNSLEKEYEKKIERNKKDTQIEVKKIINDAYKKRDLEFSEQNSNSRISIKKEYMLAKQKCFDKLMDTLKLEIDKFITSDNYKDYLMKIISEVAIESSQLKDITIYITDNDYIKYSNLLEKGLKDIGFDEKIFKIMKTKEKIVGGLIIEDNINKVRLDLSIKSLLKDNEADIMQMLFEALEAGEVNE